MQTQSMVYSAHTVEASVGQQHVLTGETIYVIQCCRDVGVMMMMHHRQCVLMVCETDNINITRIFHTNRRGRRRTMIDPL